MAYSLKYQAEFTSVGETDYRLEILEKDYVGIFYSLPLAANPVIHSWENDEHLSPVKGSSLTIRYLNEGSIPIDNFYSNSDDHFKVIFKKGSSVLFEGFLVQDDFIEELQDHTHEVTLTASDNLALLKDIKLDTSLETAYVPCMAEGDFIAITSPQQNWINLTNINFVPVVGTPFTISGHPNTALNASFTPTEVVKLSDTSYRVRINVLTGDTVIAPCTINGTSQIILNNGRLSLLNIIHACLVKTGLELNTYVYCNLFENRNTVNNSFLGSNLYRPFFIF